ncbi:hypothetical protein Tco_0593387 [Tanacetum coccineum]
MHCCNHAARDFGYMGRGSSKRTVKLNVEDSGGDTSSSMGPFSKLVDAYGSRNPNSLAHKIHEIEKQLKISLFYVMMMILILPYVEYQSVILSPCCFIRLHSSICSFVIIKSINPTRTNGNDATERGCTNNLCELGVSREASKRVMNFRTLDAGTKAGESAEVIIPLSSIFEANARHGNSLYGYFRGKRIDFPVVEHYVMNSSGSYLHTIKVEYEGKPQRCGNCSLFGHDDNQCPKHVVSKTGATKKIERHNVPSHVRNLLTDNDCSKLCKIVNLKIKSDNLFENVGTSRTGNVNNNVQDESKAVEESESDVEDICEETTHFMRVDGLMKACFLYEEMIMIIYYDYDIQRVSKSNCFCDAWKILFESS